MNAPAPETALELEGPCGFLENLLRPTPAGVEPRGIAVLCHPHPLFGGTMHNKTLYRLAKRLSVDARIASLRFNFRGVGRSLGRHDNGVGEVGDVRAAIDALREEYAGLPMSLIGYSFGAVVGLRAGASDSRVSQLVALGTPLNGEWDVDFLRDLDKPRLFVQGEEDEFGNAEQLSTFLRGARGQIETQIVPGADHLFHGVEDLAVDAVVQHLGNQRAAA